MQCWCANLPKGLDVFPGLQNGCDRASTGVGSGVSAGSVSADVRLQLLVGFAGADDRSHLESRKLQRTAAEAGLLADAAALDVDCGAGHAVFAAAGLSAGLLSFVLCRQAERSAVSDGDHSAVGQLPGAGLCLEDDSWRGRCAQ